MLKIIHHITFVFLYYNCVKIVATICKAVVPNEGFRTPAVGPKVNLRGHNMIKGIRKTKMCDFSFFKFGF